MASTPPGLSVAANLDAVRARINAAAERAGRDPASITLVAATKGVDPVRLIEALDAGLDHCGENIVQDAEERIAALGPRAGGVTWHFIGHLQSNKAGAALNLFDILESVDSVRLAEQISRRAEAAAKHEVRVLLEVNVALEPSKYGFRPEEVPAAIATISRLPNLTLEGLMTVAPAVADPEQVRPVFRELRQLAQANGLSQLSMGMTNDFEVAIEEGATSVRVGRAIFGERTR
ncbi:MAG: YggS family pyridoxal phosphate-dependent enzyme [Dehalococcoidia bacterium]